MNGKAAAAGPFAEAARLLEDPAGVRLTLKRVERAAEASGVQGGHRPAPHTLRMRWTLPGADAIATLRCQQASRPQDRIWHPRHNQAVPA